MSRNEPWDVVDAARKDREERLAQKRAAEQREQEWRLAWVIDRAQDSVPQLLRIGAVLRDRQCGFWLDYLEISQARENFVVENGLRDDLVVLEEGYALFSVAITLLKLAFQDNETVLKEEVRRVELNAGFEEVYQSMAGIHDALGKWIHGHVPPTPFMTRTELANSQNKKGFRTQSSITKKIDQGVIRIYAECDREYGRDGRSAYAIFYHTDQSDQLDLLRGVVSHLKKTKTHAFPSGPIWTAENAESTP